MTSVYIRIALYILAPIVASFGFGVWDQETGTLTLSMNEIAAALGAATLASGAIFAKWGSK
jgi:hypothetical protein